MTDRTSATFGTPEGVSEGDWFASHKELHRAGLHRAYGQGISGTEKTGADSIVLSGGYVDDVDHGDEIVYTGAGGRDRDTGMMVSDQTLSQTGNAALVVSQALGKKVRVIEGLKISSGKRRRAMGGYRYRGLYRVAEHWQTIGQDGFLICQFRLLKVAAGERVARQAVDPTPDSDTDLEKQVRRYIEQSRLVRDSELAIQVKQLHDHTCQICGIRIVVSPEGAAYSEAAHIQAVGKPHNGPDVLENMLCLCPNCHARFDRGALQILDSLEVVNGLTYEPISHLTTADGHSVDIRYVRQHRERWKDRLSEA